MRNIRTSLGLLEDCDLSKVLFHKDVEEIFRRRLAEMPELSAQIFIANRFEDQTYQQIAERYAYRYARSHAKSSDACICYAKTWATTCQW